MIESFAYIGAGILLLFFGGELLIKKSTHLARLLKISPLVIGLTVVAFGTSAPELAVSVAAALKGNTDVALGNVIGSNICNILLILGLCAIVTTLTVSKTLLKLDLPIMIVVACLCWVFALDRSIEIYEGALLVFILIAYIWTLIVFAKKEKLKKTDEFVVEYSPERPVTPFYMVLDIVLLIAAFALLVLGSRVFVGGAVELALLLGVSELVIGLTIVSIGTSLPEVAASVVAAFRGEREIAVGNVIGSNLFNMLGVLGITSLVNVRSLPVSEDLLKYDLPVMVLVSAICLPVFLTGWKVTRREGIVFVLSYAVYLSWLVYRNLN